MKRFCVSCGVEESNTNPIIDNLCIKCYIGLKKPLFVPTSIEIYTCNRCGALYIGGRWHYPSTSSEARELVEKHIVSLIKPLAEDIHIADISTIFEDSNEVRMRIVLLLKNGFTYTTEFKSEIIWRKRLCFLCFKRAGKSFEAVVQLRFIHHDELISKFKRDVEELFQDYVVDIEERDSGYDIKVTSYGVAKKIADMAKKLWRNTKVVESFGDVRRARGGSIRARRYLSVRIINLKVGDYVVVDGKAYTIANIDNKNIVLVDSDGVSKSLDMDKFLSSYEKSRVKSR